MIRSRSSAAALRLKVSTSTRPGSIAAAGDPVDNGLDDGGRLARAWPGQHQQRTARMLDDAPLRIIQPWRVRDRPWQRGRDDRQAD